MKKLLTLITLAIISVAFINKKDFAPPGTVKINDTLFVDKTEITNFNWQEFESWTKKTYGSNSKEHLAILPDTNVWLQTGTYNKPYTKYYYRHVAYREFPVVGISYEQAVAFCKWRSEVVSMRNKKINVVYTLPRKDEWNLYAIKLIPNLNDKSVSINCSLPVKILPKSATSLPDDVTTPVLSYQKNKLGVYNTFGNVAEMLLEKGICKGGSWKDNFEVCISNKDNSYENPTAWLGFRCVSVVKLK